MQSGTSVFTWKVYAKSYFSEHGSNIQQETIFKLLSTPLLAHKLFQPILKDNFCPSSSLWLFPDIAAAAACCEPITRLSDYTAQGRV